MANPPRDRRPAARRLTAAEIAAQRDRWLWGVMGLNILVFILWNGGLSIPFMRRHFLVSAASMADGRVWTLLTSAFSHYDSTHLLFNGLALWIFGRIVLRVWGVRDFMGLYIVGGVVSSLAHVGWNVASGDPVGALGASGAVMAMAVAAAWTIPNMRILLFFFIPVPMWALVPLYVVLDVGGMAGLPPGGVANAAHLGGVALGALWVLLRARRFPDRQIWLKPVEDPIDSRR